MLSVVNTRCLDFAPATQPPNHCRGPMVKHLDVQALKPAMTPSNTASADRTPAVTPPTARALCPEIIAGAKWWRHQMDSTSLSDEIMDSFEEALVEGLTKKCQGHWYPENPRRGSAFRCITNDVRMDPALINAGIAAGLKQDDLHQRLPLATVWVNPGRTTALVRTTCWDEDGSLYQCYPERSPKSSPSRSPRSEASS
mmetsp:Transcript_64802/g.153199  ORF Transcript_64802/g.153199 Transcript_64802/m.153199 type:complete len:198 (-) Transcript_64802:89-682(-)